jgi:hypothetical protein
MVGKERGHFVRCRSADILSAFIHWRQHVANPAADRMSALRSVDVEFIRYGEYAVIAD